MKITKEQFAEYLHKASKSQLKIAIHLAEKEPAKFSKDILNIMRMAYNEK